ncbi:MAG: DnaJ domain-containing protein [Deltaproteobacteria bacterium]|nr:DnaJ domain-containing protein [Deltaproteobacteria bacterium]
MFDKDLYEILGISKGASDDEIRKAYRRLAKKHHPDVNQGNKEAEHRFKEINLAYEVLKDPKKRAQYDEMRRVGANPFAQRPAGRWGAGSGAGPEMYGDFGLGDLFEEIFGGGAFGGFRPQSRSGFSFRARGADREASLTVSFLEAARGCERLFELPDGKRLAVKIPEGIDNGSKIRLAGQGEPGAGQGPAGDLILTVHVLSHSEFRREGSDILYDLPITFSESILGAEIEVPTLDGKVVLKIPHGISSGQRLKLSGRGIRTAKTDRRGDQVVIALIKVPKKPDSEYTDAAEKLRKHPFDPRS